MSDYSGTDEEIKQVDQPAEGTQEGDNLTDRQKQQLKGWQDLAQGQRSVIAKSLKVPTEATFEALQELERVEPKVAKSVLEELGYGTMDKYAEAVKQKAPLLPKEELFKQFEEFEQMKTVSSTKAEIESQFAGLPSNIKEVAETKFKSLTEGRSLTPSQLVEVAKDSITLANASTGSNFKLGALSFGSTSLKSSSIPAEGSKVDDWIAEQAKHDPFYQVIAGK